MNIFFLDPDVVLCARYHLDKHVVKMPLEYAQLLSTAHHQHNSKYAEHVYKATHVNHPSAVWCRATSANYDYVLALFKAVCAEYTYRYGKIHACERLLSWFYHNPCPIGDLTTKALAMPDKYKCACPYESYRTYYIHDKAYIAYWRKRPEPHWWSWDASLNSLLEI